MRTSHEDLLASTAKVPLRHRWDWRIWMKDRRGDNAEALSPFACLVGKWRTRRFLVFMLSLEVLVFGTLQYDTPSVFWIRCHSRFSTEDSPATVLLRHRLGRRVAAETGPATMLLRYRLGTRLVGVAYTRFFESFHILLCRTLGSSLAVRSLRRYIQIGGILALHLSS
ncbi:hypothetical protein F4677DRAFT_275774 [Hypoxylon crocopeplum]|nr:hypothetical protein F4677DRAFT_275774 [Hypoxylon crocopeplum]